MTKTSGLNQRLYVAGFDVSGDIASLGEAKQSIALVNRTGINKSAMERGTLLRDGSLQATTFYNSADDQAHEVFAALPTTDVDAVYATGVALGDACAMIRALQAEHSADRSDDGDLTFETDLQSSDDGLRWGVLLTPGVREDGATETDGDSVDNGAASSAGIVAFLQVLAIASGTATITIQSSSDDGSGDAFAGFSGSAFSAVTTARTTQRIETSGAVERYLRVASSGTFTGLSFVVGVCRK